MRSGEEFSELAELGSSYVGNRYGGGAVVGGGAGPGGGPVGGPAWTRTPARSRTPAEAEDALGPNCSPRSHHRAGRSGLYYSPPGTSYTIIERPSSAMHHHSSRDYNEHHYNTIGPRGTYLGSNPNFHHRGTPSNNKKRPISPEQVLRLFGNNQASNPKLNVERPSRRSPASSPPSTTHQSNYRVPYGPSLHELSTRTITMVREPADGTHGFGICVKGGKEAGVGVYISRVEEGSVAERVGLRPGDSILEVNGTPFTGISHEEALKMLKSCRKLSMTVKSPAVHPGLGYGGSWHTRQTCSWMDRQGRPVSPPLEYARIGQVPPQRYSYSRGSSKDRSIRKVDLCIEPGQSLGLMIRGGVEYNLGIFITGVDKESVADRAGLMVGDQILEVNGQSFLDVTHDEAVSQLKYHKRMSLLVRDVGKVPHSCTSYDRDWDLCSPGSRAAQTTRKWAAALQMVEEKARCLLTKPEFTTLCYYIDEYSARRMTIDAFVQVLTELLNTAEKYTLMTEIREIVAIEDRMRFDELVYRSEDLPRRRDPREHDYRHSRRKGGPIPETNHSLYVSGYEDYIPGVVVDTGQVAYNEDDYRSPSEDSGVGMGVMDRSQRQRPGSATNTMLPSGKLISEMNQEGHPTQTLKPYLQDYCSGDEENPPGTRSRRHSSPDESRSGSATALHQTDYSDSVSEPFSFLRRTRSLNSPFSELERDLSEFRPVTGVIAEVLYTLCRLVGGILF
ncbi:hypothetical protein Trydic_g12073 [Trypoxylus dichotomus]